MSVQPKDGSSFARRHVECANAEMEKMYAAGEEPTAKALYALARRTTHPLHEVCEWDAAKARDLWNTQTMGRLIREVEIEYTDKRGGKGAGWLSVDHATKAERVGARSYSPWRAVVKSSRQQRSISRMIYRMMRGCIKRIQDARIDSVDPAWRSIIAAIEQNVPFGNERE